MLDKKDRYQLIQHLRNQTELGRLNHDAVDKMFPVMEAAGYEVVKIVKPVVKEPVKAPEKPVEPAKPSFLSPAPAFKLPEPIKSDPLTK